MGLYDMQDCFHQFFELYNKDDVTSAIRQILPWPDTQYDTLVSSERFFPIIVNYVDAIIFGTLWDAHYASLCIVTLMEHERNLQTKYPVAYSRLKFEGKIISATMSKTPDSKLTKEEMDTLLSQVPINFRSIVDKQNALFQNCINFQSKKPEYATLIMKNEFFHYRPWYPFQYALSIQPIPPLSMDVPIVFLEPLSGDFTPSLAPLQNKPAVFIFETRTSFLQMLQFPEVAECLSDPDHLLYILDQYPNEQFAIQDARKKIQGQNFQPILFSHRKHIESTLPVLTQALKECIGQSDEVLKSDSELGNWLYQISKRLLFVTREEQLGINRVAALIEKTSNAKWMDPHKGLPPKDKPLGPESKDLMEIKLNQLAKKRVKRGKKIRLVHVVPQICDGGHAPSRLLENLILFHNPKRFDLIVISTERMQFHPFEYPFNYYTSSSSNERGIQRINLFKQHCIDVRLIENYQTHERTAENIAKLLQDFNVDAVVFHGPDVVNSMCTQITDVPLRILFEHGSQPSYPGFDLEIASSQAAVEIYKDLFEKLQMKVRVLPYTLDVRTGWLPQPLTKQQLGLPEDSLVMTTISNHLDNRLSREMLLAIVEILRRIPKAYYAPMGRLLDPDKIMNYFKEQGMKDRVILLGPVDTPSQYARSMKLYLNEFPFGSGLGILDAMSAGCPVVSMYDVEGPQQARYGGNYFGIDKVVTSGKREDYVNLACRLLTDPQMYQEWSEHAKKQYEKHSDVSNYVKSFEAFVEEALIEDPFSCP